MVVHNGYKHEHKHEHQQMETTNGMKWYKYTLGRTFVGWGNSRNRQFDGNKMKTKKLNDLDILTL